MAKYIVKQELMGDTVYYMIYRRWFFRYIFWERWNTPESAKVRLNELNHTL